MEFTIDEAKKNQCRVGTDMARKNRRSERFFRSMQHACLVVGLGAGLLRVLQVSRAGGSIQNALILGAMDLVFFAVVSLILRSMAVGAAARAMACERQEFLTEEDGILEYRVEGHSGSQSIAFDLEKTRVCWNERNGSLLFCGGVVGDEEPEDDGKYACDLQLVDYFTPSVREYLTEQGMEIGDWDSSSSPNGRRK